MSPSELASNALKAATDDVGSDLPDDVVFRAPALSILLRTAKERKALSVLLEALSLQGGSSEAKVAALDVYLRNATGDAVKLSVLPPLGPQQPGASASSSEASLKIKATTYTFKNGAMPPRRDLPDPPNPLYPAGFSLNWTKSFLARMAANGRTVLRWVPEDVVAFSARRDDTCPPKCNDDDAHEEFRALTKRVDEAQKAHRLLVRAYGAEVEDYPRDDASGIVEVFLNGAAPVPLYQRTDDPDGSLIAHFDWSQTKFDARYVQPSATAEFKKTGDALTLEEIRLKWRNVPERIFKRPADESEAAWKAALFALRSSCLLWGQVDVHLARAHFLTEFYQVAILGSLDKVHPVRKLLEPHLVEVDAVNLLGDALILGTEGVVPVAGALETTQVGERCVLEMGRIDWRGFEPRAPDLYGHRFARAAQQYWLHLRTFVTRKLASMTDPEVSLAIAQLNPKFKEFGPRWAPESKFAPKGCALRVSDRSEFALENTADGKARVETDAAMSPLQTRADLEQLCKHALYHATFFHSWVNDGQVANGGRPDFARLGLPSSAGEIPLASAGSKAFEDWLENAQQRGDLCDRAYQMLIAHILNETRVGTITDYELGTSMDPEMAQTLGRLGSPPALIRGNINA